MEDIINVANQPQTSYYQSNQSQFYTMARLRHRQDVLNKMQQTFDTYNKGSEIKEEPPKKFEKTETNEKKETENQPKQEQHYHSNYNNNLNLGNIADLLSGNGDVSKSLMKLLAGKNKDFANLLRIMDNPLIKQTFSKKQKTASAEEQIIDKQFLGNEIDKLEKVVDN